MRRSRVLKLDEGTVGKGAKHFVCSLDGVKLSADVPRTEVTILRTGRFHDPRYGSFDITPAMLSSMVTNFNNNTYGQEIYLDVAHEPSKGAAAKVLSLKVQGSSLRAEAEFTPYGVEAVKQRGFKYLSAEFDEDFVDNENRQSHGPTLLGAGLTTRPVIKRMEPVTLAEGDDNHPVFLHPELIRQLSESLEQITMKWLEELKRRLGQRKLSVAQTATLVAAYETSAKTLGEDDAAHETLVASFDDVGKQLAESGNSGAINLSVQTPAGKVLSEDDINKLLDARENARTTAANKASADRATRVKQFADAIEAATGLSPETRKQLGENTDGLITGDMSEAQVKALAENQISLGNQLEAASKLSSLGMPIRSGVTHISVDDSNSIRKLSDDIRTGLLQTRAARSGSLQLAEPAKESPFVKELMQHYDAVNAPRLHREAKMLASGVVDTGDTTIPASVQREVIKEVYQRLDILSLVNASVDPTTGPTHSIPYENRDNSALRNDAVVYEGQPINPAGVNQEMDYAYIEPRKIAMQLTNEVAFFTRNSGMINWDAWAANIAGNAQTMREIVCRAIGNRMLRDADSFGAVDVAPAATTAYTGAPNGYKTANFPVVRPYQARDLKGNAVGAADQPLIVKDGATTLLEFDGSGTQVAAKYFRVLSYNFGLFQVVDQTGAPSAPAGALTIGYSYSTNVRKVDTDIPAGSTYEKQMSKVLQAFGASKAVLSQDRYVKPDFYLGSDVLENMITDADQFSANNARADSGITADGTLQPIKGVPGWSTDAPGLDLGDERMIIGQRANFWYTIAKAFQTGAPFELFDAQGRPLGKRGAYGEEYSSLHIPEPLRGRNTSLLVYSVSTARGN